jgi:hypothetical protein
MQNTLAFTQVKRRPDEVRIRRYVGLNSISVYGNDKRYPRVT